MEELFWSNRRIIRMVSAECSRGKTAAACRYIAEGLSTSNFPYVAPTKRLLQQTRAELEMLNVLPVVIDGDTHELVCPAIMSALKAAPEIGQVLLITWQAYANLPYFYHSENWVRIIDEVPQLDEFFPFTLPYNHR